MMLTSISSFDRVRGLQQVSIHVALSLTAMLAIAITAIEQKKPKLIRRIKHYRSRMVRSKRTGMKLANLFIID